MSLPPSKPLATSAKDFAAEAATKLAQVKLVGYVQAVNAALPLLKPSSSIVLFSGLAKANPYPGSTMISVVNGSVVGVVKTLAVELGPIRVNSISPGLVPDSPTWQKAASGVRGVVDVMLARTPSSFCSTTKRSTARS